MYKRNEIRQRHTDTNCSAHNVYMSMRRDRRTVCVLSEGQSTQPSILYTRNKIIRMNMQ